MKALLLRWADSPDGVFGWFLLYDDDDHELLRLPCAEDDWLDNAPSVSCIPAGTYICQRDRWHAKDVVVFEITGVPHRDRILIHYGNTEEDVKGCVIVGLDRGALRVKDEDAPGNPVRDKWAVISSLPAFKKLMAALDGIDRFPLVIRWAQPGEWRKL
jgi:hypothetical protein